MSTDDWLAAVDDLLLERWRCCTCCGRRGPLSWANVVPIPFPTAVVLCTRCHGAEETPAVLAAVLQHRYGRGCA